MNKSPLLVLLGGSWVVISGLIIPLIRVISIVSLLRTPLITTHEPPSGWLHKEPKATKTGKSAHWETYG